MLCTGTLITPRAVLAAAHCLDAFGPEGAYELVFGPNLEGPGVLARRALANPKYDPATHEHDLALFELARDAAVAPATLPGPGFTVATGAPARVVGFGATRREGEPIGVKRSGLTRVTALADGSFEAAPDPAMSCSGDSGGPVFVAGASGEVLAGVTASGDPACNERAFNVRVDAHLDWVNARLAEFAAAPAPAPSIAAGAICSEACATRDDCPVGLRCEPDFSGRRRCTLPGAGVGSLGAACQADPGCDAGDRCVRSGEGACACFHACDAIGTPDAGGAGGAIGVGGAGDAGRAAEPPAGADEADGCAFARAPRARSVGAWPLAALLLLRQPLGRLPRARRARPRRAAGAFAFSAR